MSANGNDDDGDGDRAVDAIWANSAFDQDDDGDGDGEDTRLPLRAPTSSAAAAAADADAPAPLPPPPPQHQEIPEATLQVLEAAAYDTISFAEFCDRLETTRLTRGAAAKRDALIFDGDFSERLAVRAFGLGWIGWL